MSELPPWLTLREGAVEVRVKVVPRSSRERIAGVLGDRLKVQLHSPPVEGEANRALIDLLARESGVAPSRIGICAGAKERSKTVRLETSNALETADALARAAARAR